MRRKAQPNPISVNGVYDGEAKDYLDPNKLQAYVVEVPELERIIRAAKGRTFFVSVRQNPPARDQSEAGPEHMMTYKVYGNIVVSKHQALKFVKDAYSEKLREVARARVSISNNCVFIG